MPDPTPPDRPATHVWVRSPEADRIQKQRRAAAVRWRVEAAKKGQEELAKRKEEMARAAKERAKKSRIERPGSSVRTVSGGLPTLGKKR